MSCFKKSTEKYKRDLPETSHYVQLEGCYNEQQPYSVGMAPG